MNCKYAAHSAYSGIYFCQHPKVIVQDNLVRDVICNSCRFKNSELPSCGIRIANWTTELQEKARAQHLQYYPKIIETQEKKDGCCGNGHSFFKKTINLGIATFQHITAGLPICSSGAYNNRIKICENCPGGYFTPDRTCELCGCYMDIKARWAEQSCPKDYWPSGV